MAHQKHLEILWRGVKAWNKWRDENSKVIPDLTGEDLSDRSMSGANLKLAYLDRVNLSGASLNHADLSGAHLNHADLRHAHLARVNVSGADLRFAELGNAYLYDANINHSYLGGAHLGRARLKGADLSGADLTDARLDFADLSDVNLSGADLTTADLSHAKLTGANFFEVTMLFTVIGNVDLREAKNLETVIHHGPSSIGIDTIYKSHGDIPEKFLRGCGVPDDFITYMRSLTGKAIEFYSCFISYSSKDEEFARRLYADLQNEGVRCWFAPEDLKIGERFRVRIDESIRLYDKLLLVLSESSVASEWVEKEVETAFEKEREQRKTVLFPVRLDDAVMDEKTGWAADIRKSRHIGDFREWKNHDSYRKAFERLMRDLKAEAGR